MAPNSEHADGRGRWDSLSMLADAVFESSALSRAGGWDDNGVDRSRLENEQIRRDAIYRRLEEIEAEMEAIRDGIHPEVKRRELFVQAKPAEARRSLAVLMERQGRMAKESCDREMAVIHQEYLEAIERRKDTWEMFQAEKAKIHLQYLEDIERSKREAKHSGSRKVRGVSEHEFLDDFNSIMENMQRGVSFELPPRKKRGRDQQGEARVHMTRAETRRLEEEQEDDKEEEEGEPKEEEEETPPVKRSRPASFGAKEAAHSNPVQHARPSPVVTGTQRHAPAYRPSGPGRQRAR